MWKAKHKTGSQLELATFLEALCGGLRSIIAKHLPASYARRLDLWMEELRQQYRLRRGRDGEARAKKWLLGELRNPRLPDLRKGKSLDDDLALVEGHAKLRERLSPIFRRYRQDDPRRYKKAASIVSSVLNRPHDPEDLPEERSVSQFCVKVLAADAVRLSRARRRLSRSASQDVQRGVQFLRLAASSTQNPQVAARAQRALAYVRRHVLPLYRSRTLL